jgi:NAD-dependent deacetylase
MESLIAQAARLLNESHRTVVLTGAGISTESGIPDFRSPGGVWERYDPQEFVFPNFMKTHESRKKYWQMSREFYEGMCKAQPNAAHLTLAELERKGKLSLIITQNVDGLHQKAGNTIDKIIELHGTVFSISCLTCGKHYLRQEIEDRMDQGVEVPTCDDCSGFLKPDTVSFGQTVPEKLVRASFAHAGECKVLMVIGSSLVVFPAAQLPVHAVQHGADLIIIGLGDTPYDEMAKVVIRAGAGEAMSQILQKMKNFSD